MIQKLEKQNTWGECLEKLNEVIDAVNEIMTWRFETDEDSDWYDDPKYREQPADNSEKANCQENVQQVSYIAPGNITVFHGFNCSVEFDTPLPKGTRITIKSITKGGDNERYEFYMPNL